MISKYTCCQFLPYAIELTLLFITSAAAEEFVADPGVEFAPRGEVGP
jgi:hypothetical protein